MQIVGRRVNVEYSFYLILSGSISIFTSETDAASPIRATMPDPDLTSKSDTASKGDIFGNFDDGLCIASDQSCFHIDFFRLFVSFQDHGRGHMLQKRGNPANSCGFLSATIEKWFGVLKWQWFINLTTDRASTSNPLVTADSDHLQVALENEDNFQEKLALVCHNGRFSSWTKRGVQR